MILSDKAAAARLASPNNLMNRLSSLKSGDRKSAMSLFIPPKITHETTGVDINAVTKQVEKVKTTFNPFNEAKELKKTEAPKQELTPAIPTQTNIPEAPPIEDLIENSESQIKLALAYKSASSLLNNSLAALTEKLDEVKAEKLPGVIAAASKVVEQIRRERIDLAKANKNQDVHYHFYTPQQKKLSEYKVIDVGAINETQEASQ
jgi:hypothetical protein